MKRIALVSLFLISLSLATFAREPSQTITNKIVLARGQPQIDNLYLNDYDVIGYAENVEIVAINLEVPSENSGIAVKSSAVLNELAICTGIRKVRDVDSRRVTILIYNYKEDKRSAISNTITRLAREPNTVTS